MTLRNYIVTIAILLFIVAMMALNLYSLGHYPAPDCDEMAYANISINFFDQKGFSIDTAGGRQGLDVNHPVSSRYYHVLQGGLLRLFGTTLWVARLASFLGWVISALFVFLLGKKLFGQWYGLLAVVLFMTSLNSLFRSHIARAETWVVAGIMGAFYYYLVVRENPSPTRYAFLGIVFAVAGIGFHLNGVWFILPLTILTIFQIIQGRRFFSDGSIFILSGIVIVTLLIIAHILPDISLSIEQYRLWSRIFPVSGGFADRFLSLVDFLFRAYVLSISEAVIPYTIVTVVSIIVTLVRQKRDELFLLGLMSVSFVLFAVGTSHKYTPYYGLFDGYFALIMIILVLQIESWLSPLFKTNDTWVTDILAASIVGLPLLVIGMGGWFWLGIKYPPDSYANFTEQISDYAPEGSSILADYALFLGLYERYEFTSTWAIFWNEMSPITEEDVARVFKQHSIEYALDSDFISCPMTSHDSVVYNGYLEEHCDPIGQISDQWFDPTDGTLTQIYQCQPQ